MDIIAITQSFIDPNPDCIRCEAKIDYNDPSSWLYCGAGTAIHQHCPNLPEPLTDEDIESRHHANP